ncbi:MAG: peptidoglycan DD-metalloendopeptidase family protein [Caulobacterales bacterium]
MRAFALSWTLPGLTLLASACASGAPPAPAPIDMRTTPSVQKRADPRPAPAPVRAATPRLQPPPAALPPPVAPPPAAPRAHPAPAATDWAAGPGVPLSAYALRPDEAQPFDPAAAPKAHVVAQGETLYALSARFQVPLRALIEVNRLEAPFALSPGQRLVLPPPRIITATPSDTLAGLAARYNVDPRSLAYLNRLPSPFVVRPGDRIVIPGLARAELRPPPQEPAPASSPKNAKNPIRLAWPAKGKILARFGAQPDGKRSDGIDIQTPSGAPVRAAAAGSVVYAGDDLPGYGNLVLVKHANGWVTAYARTRRIVAKEGEAVQQGQVIAESDARLHFQLRRGAEPADPLAALPPV